MPEPVHGHSGFGQLPQVVLRTLQSPTYSTLIDTEFLCNGSSVQALTPEEQDFPLPIADRENTCMQHIKNLCSCLICFLIGVFTGPVDELLMIASIEACAEVSRDPPATRADLLPITGRPYRT